MTTPPVLDHPRLFALGVVVAPVVVSYLTVRTLRWRAASHYLVFETSRARLLVVVFGLHLLVMFGSGGILAAIHGLPSTGNLGVQFATLAAVYAPPLAVAIGLLDWFLRMRDRPAEARTPSALPLREIGPTFAGLNLTIYFSLALLFIALS